MWNHVLDDKMRPISTHSSLIHVYRGKYLLNNSREHTTSTQMFRYFFSFLSFRIRSVLRFVTPNPRLQYVEIVEENDVLIRLEWRLGTCESKLLFSFFLMFYIYASIILYYPYVCAAKR